MFNARYNSRQNVAAPIVINSLAAGLVELGGVAAAATGGSACCRVSSRAAEHGRRLLAQECALSGRAAVR